MNERLQTLGPDIFLREHEVEMGWRQKMINAAIDDYINGGSTEDLSLKLDEIDDLDSMCEPEPYQIN